MFKKRKFHFSCFTIEAAIILLFIIRVGISGLKFICHDTTVISGENASLSCQLTETNDDLTRIVWMKSTKETPEEKPFFVIRRGGKSEPLNGLGERVQFIGDFTEKNGSIQLLRMRLQDEGIYTCSFTLFPSGPQSHDISVKVLVPPDVNVEQEELVDGCLETTLVSCFASNARPAASVTWRLGDLQNSLRNETNYTVNDNGTVTVVSYLLGVPLKHLNKKKIQCVVTHRTIKNELVVDYAINIHYAPESAVIIPDNPTDPKEFECIVDSNPLPTNYTWKRMNKSTPTFKDNKLPVPKHLTPDFNGLYICSASNKYGSSVGSLYVNVHTETSTVCWGLYGSFISFAVLVVAVAVVIFKFKPKWIPVPLRPEDIQDQGSGGL